MKKIIIAISALGIITALILNKQTILNNIGIPKNRSFDPIFEHIKRSANEASTNVAKNKDARQDANSFLAPSDEMQQIVELQDLQKQVREVNARTHFQAKNMTEKEWEDAVHLLETYHAKMAAYNKTLKAEGSM